MSFTQFKFAIVVIQRVLWSERANIMVRVITYIDNKKDIRYSDREMIESAKAKRKEKARKGEEKRKEAEAEYTEEEKKEILTGHSGPTRY